jgi:hypothetical protein
MRSGHHISECRRRGEEKHFLDRPFSFRAAGFYLPHDAAIFLRIRVAVLRSNSRCCGNIVMPSVADGANGCGCRTAGVSISDNLLALALLFGRFIAVMHNNVHPNGLAA